MSKKKKSEAAKKAEAAVAPKMGQPTKFTPEIAARIVEIVATGNYRETAAASAGICARTLREWLKAGAEGLEPYATFATDVMKAEASSEWRDIARIGVAGKEDWKALAWRQEKRHARRWAPRVRIEVDEALRDFLVACEKQLPPQWFDEVLRVAAELHCAGDAGTEAGH